MNILTLVYVVFSSLSSTGPERSDISVIKPSAGFQGQATDIEIHTKEILSTKKRLNEIYSKHTGQTVETIKEALERDNFMSAEEAKKFGLVDKVVEKREN